MHFPEMPDRIAREYTEQVIVEHMADTCAETLTSTSECFARRKELPT